RCTLDDEVIHDILNTGGQADDALREEFLVCVGDRPVQDDGLAIHPDLYALLGRQLAGQLNHLRNFEMQRSWSRRHYRRQVAWHRDVWRGCFLRAHGGEALGRVRAAGARHAGVAETGRRAETLAARTQAGCTTSEAGRATEAGGAAKAGCAGL